MVVPEKSARRTMRCAVFGLIEKGSRVARVLFYLVSFLIFWGKKKLLFSFAEQYMSGEHKIRAVKETQYYCFASMVLVCLFVCLFLSFWLKCFRVSTDKEGFLCLFVFATSSICLFLFVSFSFSFFSAQAAARNRVQSSVCRLRTHPYEVRREGKKVFRGLQAATLRESQLAV